MIAVSARAQDYPAQGQAAPSSTVQAPDGTRQRLVGPHFDAQGKFVPQHYESAQKPKLHGYFANQEQKRQQHQTGYAEPAPNYTTPLDPADMKPIEGR